MRITLFGLLPLVGGILIASAASIYPSSKNDGSPSVFKEKAPLAQRYVQDI